VYVILVAVVIMIGIVVIAALLTNFVYRRFSPQKDWSNYTAKAARADQAKTNITAEKITKVLKLIASRAQDGHVSVSTTIAFFDPVPLRTMAGALEALGYAVKVHPPYTLEIDWAPSGTLAAPVKKP